jgi:hypothetical protein
MITALDALRTSLDAGERNFVDNVRKHGWIATHVSAEDEHPGFSYTTGFWITLNSPEIVVFGLQRDASYDVLASLFGDFKTGIKHPVGSANSIILKSHKSFLFPVAKTRYSNHLGWNQWFYNGDNFDCLQLVWPDPAGTFPWQAGFDNRFTESQVDLTENGWMAELAQ